MAVKPIHAFLALALALAMLFASTPVWADMALLDEDRLSDVQCKAGLSLVARAQTTGGTLRITSTGYLELDNWTINNNNGGFAQLGYPWAPATLDWGNDGTRYYMRLVLPNNMGDANAPSGQADLYMGSYRAGTIYRETLGQLQINHVYNNQSRWTLGGNTTGFRGALEYHMQIEEIRIQKGTGSRAAVVLYNNYMYGMPNSFGTGSQLPASWTGYTRTPTTPSDTLMYCSFGILPDYPMQVDIYTLATVPTGTPANSQTTRMRISYAIQGSFRVQNTYVGYTGSVPGNGYSGAHRYGPILMDNFHRNGNSGGIVIELPVTSSFYSDSINNT